jgi:large subunit ribosomal protein L19
MPTSVKLDIRKVAKYEAERLTQMSQKVLEAVEKSSLKSEIPQFAIGDTVDVHTRILEGEKERIQIFNGVVIARSGSGTREMFTVRRIVQGEGVERKFPLHSPKIAKIEVKRSGVVRRAKLYFLRDRVGKAVKLRQKRGAKGPLVPGEETVEAVGAK